MTEETHRKWDVIVKLATICISVATIFLGIWEFNSGYAENIKLESALLRANDSIKTVNDLWSKKMDVYHQISGSVGGVLAFARPDTLLDYPNKDSLLLLEIQEFEKLYFGISILVTDSTVEAEKKLFLVKIRDYLHPYRKVSYNDLAAIGKDLCEHLKSSLDNKYEPRIAE